MVAGYCEKKGNKKDAIEFLVMADKRDTAFILAQSNNEMETYANSLKEVTPEEALRIAQYHEGRNQYGEAAGFYEKMGNYNKALKLFISAGEEFIDPAIDMVSRAKNEVLTHTLTDYLMGETDGVPKDPNYTFKLYIALGNMKQASRLAISIADHAQE